MWSSICLIALLIICVVTDLKERKIYNVVLLPFLCLAFILNLFTGGLTGLGYSILGMFVGLVILLIPYLLGGMGAGDVKLLAVIGALMGTKFVLLAALYMALFGGLIALMIILFRRGVRARLIGAAYFLYGYTHGVRIPFNTDKEALSTTYPYGVAIAAGAIWQISFPTGGFIL